MISLVTGANKGIGFEVARQLDGTVLVGARDPERGRAAAEQVGGRFVQIDVTDADSVASAAKWIEAEYGRLDVLVNNAGIVLAEEYAAPGEVPVEVLRRVYETNVFGVAAVTNAMLPLLRRSDSARIVNVSSELGSLARAMDPEAQFYDVNLVAYNSSKTALNALTVAYAKSEPTVKVNAIDPGYCATDMNGGAGPLPPADGAKVAVRLATIGPDGPTGTFTGAEGDLPW